MTFYAYIYRDPSRNMEPFYVGKGTGSRAHRHLKRTDHHPMTYRIKFMKKNGIEPDIEIIHAIDESHAFFMESCLIEVIGRKDLERGTLLNLTDGGEGTSGAIRSEEACAKISARFKGRVASPETRARMSLAAKNRTPEHAAKFAVVNKGRKASPETLIKLAAAGKKRIFTQKRNAKISATLKGRIRSPEHSANISAAQKGKKLSFEHRAKISNSLKKRNIP